MDRHPRRVDAGGGDGVEADADAVRVEADFTDDAGFGYHFDGWEGG